MRKLFWLLLVVLLPFKATARDEVYPVRHITTASEAKKLVYAGGTTIILMRHAEKAPDGTRDPDLSSAGKARAKLLPGLLKKIRIDKIYSTPFQRTMHTAQPLATSRGINIINYDASTNAKVLIDKLLAENQGKTIVLVGHSDTVPEFIKELGFTPFTVADSDYDNIFVYSKRKQTSKHRSKQPIESKQHVTYGVETE